MPLLPTDPISASEMAGLQTEELQTRYSYLQGLNLAGNHRTKLRAELVRLDMELDARRRNAGGCPDKTLGE